MPCIDDREFAIVIVSPIILLAIIPATDDVRLRVDTYPVDPRPCIEDKEFIEVVVRIP
jgi:hypothetical protein